MDIKKKAEELLPKQEKSLRKAIWWMLQELHQESDVALSEEFDFDIGGNDGIVRTQQRRAIRFLNNIEVIEIISSKFAFNPFFDSLIAAKSFLENTNVRPHPISYSLKINKDKLLEVYQAYESFFGKESISYISFDTKTGTLTYKEKTVTFRPQSKSFPLLDVLVNNTDSYYTYGDTLSFGEINEIATQDGSIEEISDKAFYNILKHVNEKIKKEADINNFLIIREANIGLNSKLF